MKGLFILFSLIVYTNIINSQSAYLEKGLSGFGIGPDISISKEAFGYGGEAAYSILGIIEIGIGVENVSFEQKFLDAELSANAYSPRISIYPIKQSNAIPVSFGIHAGYSWQNYKNNVLKNYKIEMRGSSYFIGGTLVGHLLTSEIFRIQLSLGINYITGKVVIKDYFGQEESTKDNAFGFDIGLGFAFKTSTRNLLVISPSIRILEKTTSFGGGLMLIFTSKEL